MSTSVRSAASAVSVIRCDTDRRVEAALASSERAVQQLEQRRASLVTSIEQIDRQLIAQRAVLDTLRGLLPVAPSPAVAAAAVASPSSTTTRSLNTSGVIHNGSGPQVLSATTTSSNASVPRQPNRLNHAPTSAAKKPLGPPASDPTTTASPNPKTTLISPVPVLSGSNSTSVTSTTPKAALDYSAMLDALDDDDDEYVEGDDDSLEYDEESDTGEDIEHSDAVDEDDEDDSIEVDEEEDAEESDEVLEDPVREASVLAAAETPASISSSLAVGKQSTSAQNGITAPSIQQPQSPSEASTTPTTGRARRGRRGRRNYR